MSMGSGSRFLHLDKLWVVTTHKRAHFAVNCFKVFASGQALGGHNQGWKYRF